MKTSSIKKVGFIAMSLSILSFQSCTKKEDILTQQDLNIEPVELFQKEITVFDDSGDNSITLKVSGNNLADVSEYTSKNFILSTDDSPILVDENEIKETEMDGIVDEESVSHISFDIISQDLTTATNGASIIFNHPETGTNKRNPWRYYTHRMYSRSLGVAESLKMSIRRRSMTRRVYVDWTYVDMNYSKRTIAYPWTKIYVIDGWINEYHVAHSFELKVKTKYSSNYEVKIAYDM